MATALAIALAAASVAASPADAEPRPWTLAALQAAAAAADPAALAAAAEARRLRGAESATRAARGPTLDWIVLGEGPIPEAENDPDRLDRVKRVSRLRTGELGTWGVHAHAGLDLAWPLYSFGRQGAAEAAAAGAATSSEGAARAARARAARDAAEVFWSWQLARRALAALEETDRQLGGARERLDRLAAQGARHASRAHVAQLDAVRAKLATRRADLASERDVALEAARLAAGVPAGEGFALAAAPLDVPAVALLPAARYQDEAGRGRPELAAADEAVRGREAALRARRLALAPELVAIGFADLNWTSSATPQTNPFAWDPYNRLRGGLGLALRGRLDLGRARAESAQGDAELERAQADRARARRAVALEVARAHAALRTALDRAPRVRDEEAAARRWLAQAELAFDAGQADARAVLEAALAVARAGLARLEAAREGQVALADLALAIGGDPRAVR